MIDITDKISTIEIRSEVKHSPCSLSSREVVTASAIVKDGNSKLMIDLFYSGEIVVVNKREFVITKFEHPHRMELTEIKPIN